jgi:hypothetical protein
LAQPARIHFQEPKMQKTFFTKVALCLVSLALAVPAIARSWDDFTPREPSLKQTGHWEWAWDGHDGLAIGLVGAKVHYNPAGPARIVITGPDEALARVRVGQGEIRWCDDCRAIRGLDVTVSGVTLHNVALHGADVSIHLGRLDQDRLNLVIAGTGQIDASGRIDQVKLAIAGAGNIEMSGAAVRKADISITGSGDVTVTPRESANVNVTGSGRVRMTAMPARLNQSVMGSGGVRIAGN